MAYLGRKGAAAALTSSDIPDNSITAAKIVEGTILAGDLAPNSVDSSELVDGSVDLSHMSANSVDSDQYLDGSIDNEHLADDAVGTDELANDVAITTSGAAAFTGGVGIGAAKDLGAGLHIKNGDSGSGVSANADELVIEGSGDDIGMSILNTTSGAARINFSDSGGNDRGQIRFSHDSDKMFFRTDSLDRMTVTAAGRVGIGSTSPGTLLHVKGNAAPVCLLENTNTSEAYTIDIYHQGVQADNQSSWFVRCRDDQNNEAFIYSDGSFVQESDKRAKENIVDVESMLDKVKAIRIVNYNRINDDGKRLHIGAIAQEVNEIFPHLITTVEEETDENGNIIPESVMMYKIGLIFPLIKSVQELSAKNDALEAENTALKTRMDALEARVTALEG